jgi:indole-3-glycerol phosphate synthase
MNNHVNLLDQIVENKRKEVAERQALYPVPLLERSIYFQSPTVSLRKYITRTDKSGIIAEIKRQSPSRGIINSHVSVEKVSIGYMQAGASALSVLTDKLFFGGSNEDLTIARKYNFCPILRKDFIIHEYQILEAKSIGADAILLIASVLSPVTIKELASVAHSLGLEVLLEVHSREELLSNLESTADLIGVNNRNLQTFEVGVSLSEELAPLIPREFVPVSESGLDSPQTLMKLRKLGYQGFLIGQKFMESAQPERAASQFIKEWNRLLQSSKTHA